MKEIKCSLRALQLLSPILSHFCSTYIPRPRHRADITSSCYQRKAILHYKTLQHFMVLSFVYNKCLQLYTPKITIPQNSLETCSQ